MSKLQKIVSERKHKMVHNLLVKNFPGCEVKYNGIEGIDHEIIFNGASTFLETKTCRRHIRAGFEVDKAKPVIYHKQRLGTLRFDQRCVYPYGLSQHGDLIKKFGWYVFVVGGMVAGASARQVDQEICGDWMIKRVSWDRILLICYPDWLERLKICVYCH